MQKTKRIKRLSFFLCTLLVAAIALFVSGCKDNNLNSPSKAEENASMPAAALGTVLGEGEVAFNLSVVDKDGEEAFFVVHTDEKTVGDALTKLDMIRGDMGAFGLYVKTVNGITVDYDKDGKYWAFFVDGEYAASGVENTPIVPGATYSFKVL